MFKYSLGEQKPTNQPKTTKKQTNKKTPGSLGICNLMEKLLESERISPILNFQIFSPWENHGISLLKHISGLMKEMKVPGISWHQFTKGKSYQNNLIAFYHQITRFTDEGRAVDVIYLSFCKAFNVVSHNMLVSS